MTLRSIHHVLKEAATSSDDASQNRAALLKRMVWIMLSTFDFSTVVWEDGIMMDCPDDDGIDEDAAFKALPRGACCQEVSGRCSDANEFDALFEQHGVAAYLLPLAETSQVKAILDAPLPTASTGHALDWIIAGFVPREALVLALKIAFADDPTIEKSVDDLKSELSLLKAQLAAYRIQQCALVEVQATKASATASKRSRVDRPAFPSDVYDQLRVRGEKVVEAAAAKIKSDGLDATSVDAVVELINNNPEFLGLSKSKTTTIKVLDDDASLEKQDLAEYASDYIVHAVLTYQQLYPNQSFKPGCTTSFLGVSGIDIAHGSPVIRFLRASTVHTDFPPLIQFKRKASYTAWTTFGVIPDSFAFRKKTSNGQDIVKDISELPGSLFPVLPAPTTKKQKSQPTAP